MECKFEDSVQSVISCLKMITKFALRQGFFVFAALYMQICNKQTTAGQCGDSVVLATTEHTGALRNLSMLQN